MTTYARSQENRCEKKFTDNGFTLVKDTGRLTTHAGEKIMEHESTGVKLVIDHKSTRGQKQIIIKIY